MLIRFEETNLCVSIEGAPQFLVDQIARPIVKYLAPAKSSGRNMRRLSKTHLPRNF